MGYSRSWLFQCDFSFNLLIKEVNWFGTTLALQSNSIQGEKVEKNLF